MSDAASFDAIMQCNLLEVFCEALGAAVLVTDKLDELSFASLRLMHLFPIPEAAIAPGGRARDLYGALFDAGCRFGVSPEQRDKKRDDWVAERVASSWKERVDAIEQSGPDRWFRIVSRRFGSGLGLTVIQDISEHKKKEMHWRGEQERVRMTEEILDTLPVAIAIKDRNLNFAAVNQQFCKMLRVAPDNVLGRSIWDIFEHGLAASLEEADWHLLATGDDREWVIKVDRPEIGPASFLHRARRIGKPGHHYLAMSFDEMPIADNEGQSIVPPDLTLRVGADDRAEAAEPLAKPLTSGVVSRRVAKLWKVAHVDPVGQRNHRIAADADLRNIELCTIRSEEEFAAFLPALTQAGIKLDLVAMSSNAGLAFAVLADKHGVRHITLPPDIDVIEGILDVLERRSVPPAADRSETSRDEAKPDMAPKPATDILAVEDNAINRLALEQIFESLGLNFEIAGTGQEAIGRLAELRPKVVLADTTLPDILIDDIVPSFEARFDEVGIKPPLIAMITADLPDPRRAAHQAGFIDTLAKPLSPDAIDGIIRKHLLNESIYIDIKANAAA